MYNVTTYIEVVLIMLFAAMFPTTLAQSIGFNLQGDNFNIMVLELKHDIF